MGEKGGGQVLVKKEKSMAKVRNIFHNEINISLVFRWEGEKWKRHFKGLLFSKWRKAVLETVFSKKRKKRRVK